MGLGQLFEPYQSDSGREVRTPEVLAAVTEISLKSMRKPSPN